MAELATQAAKERQHHLPVSNGIAELGERYDHGLEAATVVGDRQGVLAEVAELCLEEEGTRLLLPKELVLEEAPCLAGGALPQHEGLLQVAGDGAVDPRQDDAVRLRPRRARGEGRVLEDMAS